MFNTHLSSNESWQVSGLTKEEEGERVLFTLEARTHDILECRECELPK